MPYLFRLSDTRSTSRLIRMHLVLVSISPTRLLEQCAVLIKPAQIVEQTKDRWAGKGPGLFLSL